MFIPFRVHPTIPAMGVLATFDNGVSVLLEPRNEFYEVMDSDGTITRYFSIEALTKALVELGCHQQTF